MKTRLITILHPEAEADRTWCGNDQTGCSSWNGKIPAKPDPVSIALSWRSNSKAPVQYIGTFSLHLSSLLRHGYIRSDEVGHVRITFINDDGVIKLATGRSGPSIVIGYRN